MMQSRSLLLRATSEINACRTTDTTESFCFDIKKLCGQPLLQSSFAETLRMYIADFILRKPEYEDALILDYKIPRNKSILISSTMAHMDKRHWNLGVMEEHPVEKFWADRFLTYSRDTSSSPASTPSLSATSSYGPPDPKFSLNGYSGSWIPFGGGLHQCPGRHWVKVQMLLSFAIISEAFEIEPLAREGGLKVDMGKYGLGALIPAEKAGFRIRRKKTAV